MAQAPTTSLQPGMTGSSVLALQNYLVSLGLMTQAQVNTGPGVYGPQTTAAVQKLQQQLGVNNSSGPGYYGPQTIAAATKASTSSPSMASLNNGTSSSTGSANSTAQSALSNAQGIVTQIQKGLADGSIDSGTAQQELSQVQQGVQQIAQSVNGSGSSPTHVSSTSSSGLPSTGNTNLDRIQDGIVSAAASNNLSIPPGLQITPALTQQFLAWAHQVVDPQTQQLISAEAANINASLQNASVNFKNTQAEDIQQFGSQLASQDNSMAGSGIAFSGLRNLTDQNLANSTNRTLSSLSANTAYNMGNTLRTGAANVGSQNTNLFNLPGLTDATVGVTGGNLSGGQGVSNAGPALDFSYNPNIYTAGVIPSNQSTAANQLAGNYLSQYTTLAGSNSGRSMSDLIAGVSGLPSNYQVPANLT